MGYIEQVSVLLEAPCVFCGYRGANYWQRGTHPEGCPWHLVDGGVVARREWLGTIVRALYRAQEGWIPVAERLPPTRQWVLVHNGKWTGVGKYVGWQEEESERWQSETCEFIEHLGPKVTHWMPLPAAPKEPRRRNLRP